MQWPMPLQKRARPCTRYKVGTSDLMATLQRSLGEIHSGSVVGILISRIAATD